MLKNEKFEKACDAVCNSKFILIDKKLSDIVKIINTDKELYNIVAESRINFNIKRMIENCRKDGIFKTPEKKHEIIALVYTLLENFDSKSLNSVEFITTNFSNNIEDINAYNYFCKILIEPFKNAIINKSQKSKSELKNNSITIEVYNRIVFLLNKVKENPLKNKLFKDKEMLQVLQSAIECCENRLFLSAMVLLDIIKKSKISYNNSQLYLNEILEIVKNYDQE